MIWASLVKKERCRLVPKGKAKLTEGTPGKAVGGWREAQAKNNRILRPCNHYSERLGFES